MARPGCVFLILIRHGEAGKAPTDAARELTDAGRATVRKLGGNLILLEYLPDMIRCSPLLRALQTAEILQGALGGDVAMDATDDLAPGCTDRTFDDILLGETPGSTVFWVGHMPDLGRFAARLLGATAEIPLRPGEALGLDVDLSKDPPRATKKWEWRPA